MTDRDHVRKDIDGSFVDLCGACYGASQMFIASYREEDELAEEALEAPQKPNLALVFDAFIERHNLMESWADGLGLKWTPEERQTHFYNKCYREFVDLMSIGYGTLASLERACGIHKADRRHEFSGASFAHVQENSGNFEDTSTGGSDVAITDWMS
jgi:hypothetical protein